MTPTDPNPFWYLDMPLHAHISSPERFGGLA